MRHLFASLLTSVAAWEAPRCKKYGNFTGSEDATLWLDGLALQTSGLYPNSYQGGMLLGVNLTGAEPTVQPLTLRNMPKDFGFHPHGMHLDNTSRRLYTVCHSDIHEEESVVVFDIRGGSRDEWPSFEFKYALVSPRFDYVGPARLNFLNDVSAVDGHNELFTTQFGPQRLTAQGQDIDKYLWRCTWDENDVRSDGRLPAFCEKAFDKPSGGLNGINIDRATNRLFVNDLYTPELWVFDRNTNGSLFRADTMPLPGVVDNVERDFASGDLQMGLIMSSWTGGQPPAKQSRGGVQQANCTDKRTNKYGPVYWPLLQDSEDAIYGVSTSLLNSGRAIIGSPGSTGPIICDTTIAKSDTSIVV